MIRIGQISAELIDRKSMEIEKVEELSTLKVFLEYFAKFREILIKIDPKIDENCRERNGFFIFLKLG